jgi:hypothetical protein
MSPDAWGALKDDVHAQMRQVSTPFHNGPSYSSLFASQWYRATHGMTTSGHVEDLVCVLEAYWGLSVARSIDCVCMAVDKTILQRCTAHGQGHLSVLTFYLRSLPSRVQEELYRYVNDDALLTKFFTESDQVTSLRAELTRRRERLSKAHSTLGNVPTPAVSQVQTPDGEMLKVHENIACVRIAESSYSYK